MVGIWCILKSFLGDKPLAIMTTLGDGSGGEVLFAAWDFPGNKGPASDMYFALLRFLAGGSARVTISPAGDRDDTNYICYSVYKTKAYLLNIDCVQPRTVTVRVLDSDKQPLEQVVEIPPCTVKVLEL